jgi:hypothetical protein
VIVASPPRRTIAATDHGPAMSTDRREVRCGTREVATGAAAAQDCAIRAAV